MRAVIQRVTHASVSADGDPVGSIGEGLLILLGIADGDGPAQADRLAAKSAELRVFSDGQERFNLSLAESRGEALVVSQFTLLADTRKGRRPSFVAAAAPEVAEPLFERFVEKLRNLGIGTQTGRFGAHMLVELENDGPVTIILDSDELERPRRN